MKKIKIIFNSGKNDAVINFHSGNTDSPHNLKDFSIKGEYVHQAEVEVGKNLSAKLKVDNAIRGGLGVISVFNEFGVPIDTNSSYDPVYKGYLAAENWIS